MSALVVPNLHLRNGNPSIPFPANHHGGRVLVCGDGDNLPVWIGAGVATGEQTTAVNVWNGTFQGSLRGAAVLPAGSYVVDWEGVTGQLESLGGISIDSVELFDTAFPNRIEADGVREDWEMRTSPEACPYTLPDTAPTISGFRAGAMHGTLRAIFACPARTSRKPAVWGLISRYYSRFHHLRLSCQSESSRVTLVRLSRVSTTVPDRESEVILAEHRVEAPAEFPMRLEWAFNGDIHLISCNDRVLMTARDGYMGGVDIVGWFSAGSVRCERAQMETTQHTPRHRIERPGYIAGIRPGNIDYLTFPQSGAPDQNICWESGIQFGHIGGSEIKFTQSAKLHRIEDGPVASVVRWQGPMPKFVEQANDVRGMAEGTATFYADQIVIADDVLARTTRSVGPDIDLLSRLLTGPARVALGNSRTFRDWALPADGAYAFLQGASQECIFPAIAGFPLRLGTESWWLTAMILLRSPAVDQLAGTSAFAWQCPSLLTASHDFRCAPTQPGREYGYTIVIGTLRTDDVTQLEAQLLQQRDAWLSPMIIQTSVGSVVDYAGRLHDAPSEASDFDGCFDRRSGRYVLRAERGELSITVDPIGLQRWNTVLAIRDLPGSGELVCCLDSFELSPGKDYVWQRCLNQEIWISLGQAIRRRAKLSFRVCERKSP